MIAPYKLTFYSAKKNKSEDINFYNLTEFQNLKMALLGLNYIKDLKAFRFDSKAKMYVEIRL